MPVRRTDGPVVRLNRAVAVGEADGPRAVPGIERVPGRDAHLHALPLAPLAGR
ncbi:hypothetical protein J5X86_35005 [Streptomyces sp. NEAU-YJ-81]|nr:hypothetical protein [Streptomyces sp. NEAU-YJ-81]MBO3680168.1 hypothetical protein [Streptomyces sp. NEAU-YJ-81]